MPRSMPNLSGSLVLTVCAQNFMHGGFAAAQIRTVDDIIMDQHEIMQEFHAGGGIIKFAGDFFG